MSKQDTTKNVVFGLAIGLAAGYIAGLLTAPKSGAETRKDVRDTAGRTVKLAQGKLEALQAQLSDLFESAKERAEGLTARGKQELDELIADAKDKQAKAKAVFAAVKDGEADDPLLRRALESAQDAKESLAYFLKRN